MCDYTQVEYGCGHLRWTVRAWCMKYQETQKRCPANVVAYECRPSEKCGDCRETSAKYPISSVKGFGSVSSNPSASPSAQQQEPQQRSESAGTSD